MTHDWLEVQGLVVIFMGWMVVASLSTIAPFHTMRSESFTSIKRNPRVAAAPLASYAPLAIFCFGILVLTILFLRVVVRDSKDPSTTKSTERRLKISNI